jgi:hypothetical protein
MAITFVNAGAASSGNTSSLSNVALPSGIQADDFALLMAMSKATGGVTLNAVTNWTGETQVNNTLDTVGTLRTRAYHRVLTSSESNPTVGASGSQTMIAGILAFRGVKTADSIHQLATSTGGNGTSSGTVTAPSVTTTKDGCMIVRVFITADDITHSDWSEGTNAFYRVEEAGSDASMSISYVVQNTAGATGTATVNVGAAADSARGNWLSYTIALAPLEAGDPTSPGSGWTHFTQLSQDYALLPGEAPSGGDPGWGTKAYLPDTVTAGTWVRYRGINDTDISSVSNLGVIAFVDQSDGDENDDTPYEFEWDLWDSGAWADDPTEFTFAFETFGGLLKDTFTAANDTNVNGREPDVQVGSNTWSRQKFNTTSPDPTLNVTIQSNRLACPEDQIGVEYDIGTRDFTMEVDWFIPSDAPSTFGNYVCFRREDGANWLNINCRRSNGDLRLQRRIGGTTATFTSATGLTWAANTAYKLKIQCITNTVRVWRDNVLLIETQIDTNQSAGATKIWLGAAGGASASTPVLYDNLQVFDEFILLEPQVPSASTTLPPFGSTVSIGISPPGLVPQSAKWGGVTIPIANEDASGLDIVTPALTDYLPGGDFEDVDFVNGAEVTIKFASGPDLTIFVSPIPDESMNESGAEWWFGQAPSPGLDEQEEPLAASGIFAGFSLNESYLVRVTQGTITGITEAGVVQGPHPWTVELYRFVS